jgi:site-specific DNA-methyltransferase (adenine-specific)
MTEDILTPFVERSGITVYKGDCVETMRRMPEASVDAIITDPPYGLEFMGREWDGFGTPLSFQTWTEAWAREAYRVLKPGGHLLAFAGTRTYHRMASGVEDAAFEIRDCIAWMYGSGFPKSLDVSKAIDKAAGAEREVRQFIKSATAKAANMQANGQCQDCGKWKFSPDPCVCPRDNGPQTEEAVKWFGWGTALKPAFEPIVVARKPLIGTVAQNVLEHGTGALNIDATRIGVGDDAYVSNFSGARGHADNRDRASDYGMTAGTHPASGRWPANVALDDEAAKLLDEQSGETRSSQSMRGERAGSIYGNGHGPTGPDSLRGHTDTGGASRFFYCAKASKRDRNTNGAANTHPTVKPTELMRWMIRLVTPPGGIILDPFGGSGSTGVAAQADSVRCILIEREDEYLQIIRDRLDDGSLFSELA